MASDENGNDVGSGARMHDRAASALWNLLLHKPAPPPVLSPPRYAHIVRRLSASAALMPAQQSGPTFSVAEIYPLNPRPRFPKGGHKATPDEPSESVEDRRAALLALAEDEDRKDELSDEVESALVAFITSETLRTTCTSPNVCCRLTAAVHITNSPPRRKPSPADAATDKSSSKPASVVKPAAAPLSPRKPSSAKRAPSRSSSPSQRSSKKPRTSTGSTDENAPGSATAPIEL